MEYNRFVIVPQVKEDIINNYDIRKGLNELNLKYIISGDHKGRNRYIFFTKEDRTLADLTVFKDIDNEKYHFRDAMEDLLT